RRRRGHSPVRSELTAMESGRTTTESELATTTPPSAPDASRRHTPSLTRLLTPLRGRFEFGDALLFVYLLAFARQYFWVIDNNALAWTLSAAAASVPCYFYVRTKP